MQSSMHLRLRNLQAAHGERSCSREDVEEVGEGGGWLWLPIVPSQLSHKHGFPNDIPPEDERGTVFKQECWVCNADSSYCGRRGAYKLALLLQSTGICMQW
jgi:hypothetical protein